MIPETDYEKRLNTLIEDTSNYYGDSIGLMLGVGLVEEAQHEDFSSGGSHVIGYKWCRWRPWRMR